MPTTEEKLKQLKKMQTQLDKKTKEVLVFRQNPLLLKRKSKQKPKQNASISALTL